MAFALRRAARIGIRVILGVLLSGATMAGIGAAGVAQTMGTSFGGTAPSAPPEGWPAAAVAPPGRIAVAVVLGATGSVVTDALAPIEVFARSSAFFVYTVSVHRQPVPLSGGLHVLPDHALADVDAGTAPRPGVVVVPAVIDPTGPAQAPLRAWITRQANRGARILGVCAGSVLLAETGLLDGLQATSFWQRISGLRRAHPAVRWRSGVRYVEDGPVTTTAGVTSGVVGALRLVEKLAGTQEAERIGTDIGYPGWSLDGSIAIAVNRIEVADLPYALNAAFPWWRPTVGIGLNPGVGEIDLAAAFEVYSGTSSAAATVAIAAGRTVVTRHGVVLVAEPANAATPAVERLVVPGVRAAAEVVPRWPRGPPTADCAWSCRTSGGPPASSASTRCCATLPRTPTGPPRARRPSTPSTRPTSCG